VISASDEHFGRKANLLLPGRGMDMSDGWETKRSRGKGHVDWVVVKLAARGMVRKVVVDTLHFRGNYPKQVQVFAIDHGEGEGNARVDGSQNDGWTEILQPARSGPDQESDYEGDCLVNVEGKAYTHVKMVIIPDGGVKRLRVFGTLV